MDYKVIVPNLDRRPDRWRCCRGILLEQGTPRDKIERFSAFDMLEFRGLPDSAQRFRESLIGQFGSIPRWLDKESLDGESSWPRTWYTILKEIASGTENVLLLIDDRTPPCTYDVVCRHLEILANEPEPLAIKKSRSVERYTGNAIRSWWLWGYCYALYAIRGTTNS